MKIDKYFVIIFFNSHATHIKIIVMNRTELRLGFMKINKTFFLNKMHSLLIVVTRNLFYLFLYCCLKQLQKSSWNGISIIIKFQWKTIWLFY